MGAHNVLNHLAEAPEFIPDPGASGVIAAAVSGAVQLVTADAETRTLMPPAFMAQVLCLTMKTDGGDAVVNCMASDGSTAQAFDGTNNELTFDTVGESAVLIGYWHQDTLYWGEIHMEGVTQGTQ